MLNPFGAFCRNSNLEVVPLVLGASTSQSLPRKWLAKHRKHHLRHGSHGSKSKNNA